jgi:lipid II:glycine glycyltransferase (peptidoglycan interpeptide bridge formation enzyme)
MENCGYEYEPHLNYHIDLRQSENDLWYKISKSKRKCINREIDKLEFNRSTDLKDAFKIIEYVYKKIKLPLFDKSIFLNAKNILGKDMLIYYLCSKNKPIATRLIIKYDNVFYDWYAGALEPKETSFQYVNDIIVWQILRDIVGKGKIFDFGGAGHPDKPYGVREFKRRFGGEMVNFGRFKKIYSPIKMKIIEKGFSLYRKVMYR